MPLAGDNGTVLAYLAQGAVDLRVLLADLDDRFLSTPCASGEWTIKEVVAHIIDDERIYTYRTLRGARGDATELPGFDQDAFATESRANARSITSLLNELDAVRLSTLLLFDSLDDDVITRVVVARALPMSVRAAAYHIAGHERHHINSIVANYLAS
jgi:uncharacterized damage-inducible protein DinB